MKAGKRRSYLPTFPFSSPHKHRLIEVNESSTNHVKTQSNLITRVENVRDNPKNTMDEIVPTIPNMSTGFLPIRSDILLHWKTVIASVTKNNDSWNERYQVPVSNTRLILLGAKEINLTINPAKYPIFCSSPPVMSSFPTSYSMKYQQDGAKQLQKVNTSLM